MIESIEQILLYFLGGERTKNQKLLKFKLPSKKDENPPLIGSRKRVLKSSRRPINK